MKIDNSLINTDAIKSQYSADRDKTGTDRFARELENAVSKQDKHKLMASCQELESVFINKIIECMRATVPESGLIEKSFATESFESMLDEEYAKQMSKTGSIGLADILYKQLSSKL
ncbi:MAG: rod-binding protein [Syntrophomonas sp.]|nr:rod-binding protein [Syntrophomonas sp.]